MKLILDTMNVKYVFSVPEIADLARQQSAAYQKKCKLDHDLATMKKQFGAQIAEEEAKSYSISNRVANGFEMRDTEIMIIKERLAGYSATIRLDTGCVVRMRKMDESERQMEITTEPPEKFVVFVELYNNDTTYPMATIKFPLYKAEWELVRGKQGVACEYPWTIEGTPE